MQYRISVCNVCAGTHSQATNVYNQEAFETQGNTPTDQIMMRYSNSVVRATQQGRLQITPG